jgi:hypothetical protein
MKNLELNALGVSEMNVAEMQEVDGGFIPLIIIGIALLSSSCTINVTVGDNNRIDSKNSADSTGNGNSVK